MIVLNKDWWDVVLLHFAYTEWKQNDWPLISDTFIPQEEQLVPRVIRNSAIFKSLHMRITFQFRFSIRSNADMSSGSDYKKNKPPLTNL